MSPRFNLNVDEQDLESFTGNLGWQVSVLMDTPIGPTCWQVRAAWRHEFLDQERRISAQLQQSNVRTIFLDRSVTSGNRFRATGLTPEGDDDYLSTGAGIGVELSESLSVYADYQGQFSRYQKDNHWAGDRMSIRFG